jgi:uncharacterized protein (TIGR02646 family)
MIRIDRGDEPPELTSSRIRQLALAALSGPPTDFVGYDVSPVKERLWETQHRKCAYCERPQGLENQPIEHFRPKAHYWWLAWTWENLFFACYHCNGQGIKGDHFPIQGPALAAWDFDLTHEDGLVDPSLTDPLDHIRWVPMRATGDRSHWAWIPRPHSLAGSRTLRVFDWKKESLGVEVTHHIRTKVLEDYQSVSGQPARWYQLHSRLLSGYARFQAATWCALEVWRDQDKLSLPSLPRPGHARPFVVPRGLPAAPAGTPNRAWWRLLAQTEYDEAILEICDAQPRNRSDLVEIFQASFASDWRIKQIPKMLKALVEDCRLQEADGVYATRSTPGPA